MSITVSYLAILLSLGSLGWQGLDALHRRSLARCDHVGVQHYTGSTHLGPGTWCGRCMKILANDESPAQPEG